MTRGKLLDRIKVELAGGIAVRVVVGEETNFGLPGKRCLTGIAAQLLQALMHFPACSTMREWTILFLLYRMTTRGRQFHSKCA